MELKLADKVKKALKLAETLEHITHIEEKIQRTDKIKRRTKKGRELTETLLNLTSKRSHELINDKNIQPF